MLSTNYLKLFDELKKVIPDERLFCDELRTLAYGTDAIFYRLTPKIVVSYFRRRGDFTIKNVMSLMSQLLSELLVQVFPVNQSQILF